MDNLEWLNKVKKADGDIEKVFKKEALEIGEIMAGVVLDYRKIKALEIIAEEFCKFNNRAEIRQEELNRFEEIKGGK